MKLTEMLDAERNTLRFEETIASDAPRRSVSHRKYSTLIPGNRKPSPDYLKRSILSIFLCFVWGILAFRASRKVREHNNRRSYQKAEYYSEVALRHNRSALACSIVMALIVFFPLAVSLLVPLKDYSKYLNARHYFG